MSHTVSETLVKGLVDQGVTQMFGVVGDALNSVTDAIRRTDGIRWVGTRHEEVAAFAAGAVAQLTGRLGVCAGTVGPGCIHLLNGLYDAAKSHAPVLAIAGQVPLADMGSHYFQEVDNDQLFRDVSVYHHTITCTGQVPYAIEQAIEAALAHRGVAVLSVPGDVGSRTVEGGRPVRVFGNRVLGAPSPDALAHAVEAINKARTVTILAGAGARDAREEVLATADTLSAPMVVTLKGKEIFDWDNEFEIGQTGLLGNPAAHSALSRCDLLLMIGTDFPYRDWYPSGPTVVQIDTSADHIGRRTHVDIGLVADAGGTLRAMADRLRPGRDRSHLERSRDEYRQWRDRQARLADPEHDTGLLGGARSAVDNPGHRIRPEAVAALVGELADDDAVFTSDTGMATTWLARFVRLRPRQRLIGSYNLGSMANAMPQAIGIATAEPERQVVAMCGDGGLTMLLGDLITLATYRLGVKLVVFDNNRLGMVKLEQEQAGLPEFGTVLDNPDLAAVAQAVGVQGVRISDPAQLRDGLAQALRIPGPVLIDVLTNPDEVSVPPRTTVGQASGFAVAKLKEMVRSRGDGD